MRLYLDEDLASTLLVRLLLAAGHDAQGPSDVGLLGASDIVEFTHAIRDRRIFLTRNYDDFEKLDILIHEARGQHPGILAIRRDNDPRRNMSPRTIVRALRNLESASAPLADVYQILNAWQ
jgi:predicted nuclease of predicted toxin-antitoxin system